MNDTTSPNETTAPNDTIQLQLSHRSCRQFVANQTLSSEHRTLITRAALQAASWMNGQHYSIIRIENNNLRAKISALQPKNPHIATCSEFWVFVADVHKVALAATHHGLTVANDQAELLLISTTDAALAAQNAVTAAESLGYGTCFIGSVRTIARELGELLQLPPLSFALFGLCIGVKVKSERAKPRMPHHVMLSDNHYLHDTVLKESLADYEQVMAAFGETREVLPYREKLARFWSQTYAPSNETFLQYQGFNVAANTQSSTS